ncbi:MAG TPA: hypothetical protein DDX51_01575 [Clostridiales bacterium]|nr:hypothetical protein [Clostridiales bacterium]
MIRYGFIRTKDEIKFLILTCMTYLPFPVSYDAVVDICTWCDDGFGYFELSEAFAELQSSAHIEKSSDTGEELFSITQKGRDTAEAFQNRLPYTVREAAELSALRVIRKIRRDAQISARTEQFGEKDFVIELSMEDVFSIRMNVVSRSQAALLEHNFKKHAEEMYQQLLSALTRSYEETE